LLRATITNGTKRKIRSLIVIPAREQAIKTGERFKAYGRHTGITCTVIFGGGYQNPQTSALRTGIDILIATTGRLLDLMNQGQLTLHDMEILILAGADRIPDMDFIHDVKRIINALPK